MFSTTTRIAALSFLMIAGFAASANAADETLIKGKIKPPTVKSIETDAPNAPVSAQAKTRLKAHIFRDGTVLSSFNVLSVTKPSTGIFCIKPTAGAGINLTTMGLAAIVDYSNTIGLNVQTVQYSSSTTICPGAIAIRTLEVVPPSTSLSSSDNISFTVEAW